MKVAHAVKRIEMIDDDIKQLKRLESQLGRNKKFANPIIISIEKQINILLAERIKYLELKIENPPAFMEMPEKEEEELQAKVPKPISRIKVRKKNKALQNNLAKTKQSGMAVSAFKDEAPDNMLTQDMIDKKFEEARKKLMNDASSDSNQKKKGLSGVY